MAVWCPDPTIVTECLDLVQHTPPAYPLAFARGMNQIMGVDAEEVTRMVEDTRFSFFGGEG
jgi:hypothetical protein